MDLYLPFQQRDLYLDLVAKMTEENKASALNGRKTGKEFAKSSM